MRYVKTVCPRDCYDTCSIIVGIDDSGRIVSVMGDSKNPVTQGFICPRGIKDLEWVYVNRVLYPHVGEGDKPSKDFKRIPWNEALGIVAEKLKDVLKEYDPKAVLHLEYASNIGLLTWYFLQRLWNAIGATKTDHSICSRSGREAMSLHYGLSYGIRPEELLKMRLITY